MPDPPHPRTAPCVHVPHPREGYQAGDSGSEGVACAWVQVPAAGPEAAGEAGCRAAEVWRRHHGERMLLAWAQGVQVCDQAEDERGVLGGEDREEPTPGRGDGGASGGSGMDRDHDMGV